MADEAEDLARYVDFLREYPEVLPFLRGMLDNRRLAKHLEAQNGRLRLRAQDLVADKDQMARELEQARNDLQDLRTRQLAAAMLMGDRDGRAVDTLEADLARLANNASVRTQ